MSVMLSPSPSPHPPAPKMPVMIYFGFVGPEIWNCMYIYIYLYILGWDHRSLGSHRRRLFKDCENSHLARRRRE